jgi:aconitate hydratase
VPGLSATALEAHGLASLPLGRDGERALPRVDQALLGTDAAALVAAALERAGVSAIAVRPALVDPGAAAGAPGGHDWRAIAVALGMRLPRPGHDDLVALQREQLAQPGGLVACAGTLAACGALGMLPLPAAPLDLAALLAGAPLALSPPRVRAVALEGALPRGADGTDLALVLLAGPGDEEIVELAGPGVAALPMADRCAVAWLLAQSGRVALFPSDEATRAFMAACGRDEAWRRVDSAAGRADAVLDLSVLVPRVARVEAPEDAAPLVAGEPVARVWVGPGATFADVARFAAAIEPGVAAGVECVVRPGTRLLAGQLASSGVAARLAAAGARVVAEDVAGAASGTGLCCGVTRSALAGARARWLLAGIGTCAAAARTGALGAWLEPLADDVAVSAPAPRGGEAWLTEETDGPRGRRARRHRAPALAPWRGEVLAVLGDDVSCAALLPPGPRLEALRGRLHGLAGRLLAGLAPGFAERARVRGGGALVAGERFGAGQAQDLAAACLAEVGVRVVLARSFAPGARGALTRAGVLPLAVAAREAPVGGSTIELPGLPTALVPERDLSARDLTRGRMMTLAHERSAREVAMLRAGGLLPFVHAGEER